MASLSREERVEVIKAYENGEGSLLVLAKRFNTSRTSIQTVLKRYREGEDIGPKPGPTERVLINEEGLAIIQQLLQEDSKAMLSELCERFAAKTNIKVAIVTMHRACRRLKMKECK